jgi:hypothetical protein
MKNPKSETRNPKEVRNPKAECEKQGLSDNLKFPAGNIFEPRLRASDFGFFFS